MKYQFETLLGKEGIQETELSVGLRKKISDLRKVENAIPEAEAVLKGGNLSIKKQQELQKKVEDSKAALPDMDTAIVDGIKKWIPKRVQYAEAAKRLAETRPTKAASGATTGSATSTPAPEPAKPAPPEPAKPARTQDKSVQAVDSDKEKKGMSPWGWLFVGLAALALGAVGVDAAMKYVQKNKI